MASAKLIEKTEDLGRVAEMVASAEVIGLDIETYNVTTLKGEFDPLVGAIRLIQLNVDDREGGLFVVDVKKAGNIDPLVQAFRDTNAVFVIHNAKFEQKWFKHHFDFEFDKLFCTFRAEAVLTNGKGLPLDLWSVSDRYLGTHPDVPDMGGTDWGRELTETQYKYAEYDVVDLIKLRKAIRPRLFDDGLVHTAMVEFKSLLPEGCIELNGLPFDQEAWLELHKNNWNAARAKETDLYKALPNPTGQQTLFEGYDTWNLDSPAQLLASLRRMGVPVENTAEADLALVSAKYPIVSEIFEYRKYSKRCSSFGEDYLKWLHPLTGRIHTSYYALLASGRFSSSKPNLQQIPRDAEYRRCFKAPKGKTFVAADYSGIEMRIVAEIAKDRELIGVFQRGEDAHYATAAIMANKAVADVTKKERQAAKAVNFGLIYGMMPPKLVIYAKSSYGVDMTLQEAEAYWKRYFDKYRGIKAWHGLATRDGKRQGFVRSMGGRIRYVDPEKAWNILKNTPVQGTGADALKMSMRLIHDAMKPYGSSMKMVHIVHDEVILEVDDEPECVKTAENLLQEQMTIGMKSYLKNVPVEVDPASGPTWADCK